MAPEPAVVGVVVGASGVSGTIHTEAPAGSQFQPIYMGRKMKIYPVYESDLEGLELFADLTTMAIAVITLIVGFALNIVWDAFMSPADSPRRVYGAPVIFISFAFVVAAAVSLWWAIDKKRGVRKRIERESYEIGAGAAR